MGDSVNDRSNGYEAIAEEFSAIRRRSDIGAESVKKWSQLLKPGSEILDLGCGSGIPISQTLINGGFNVYGIDASSTLVSEFTENFPNSLVLCEDIATSEFFNRSFDAVISWGLFFLLPTNVQFGLIRRLSLVIKSGGRLMFTSPSQAVSWNDVLTGRESFSPGANAYKTVLEESNFRLESEFDDKGGNHYYTAVKQSY